MNPEQWLSLKWNDGSTMSDRWLNQSKIIQIVMNVQKIKILMIGKENILAGNKIAGLLVIAEKLWNKYKV